MRVPLSTLLGLVALVAVACGKPGAHDSASTGAPNATPPERPPAPAGVVASWGRGVCYGPCPGYSVTIKSDGTVTYHGETFVITTGNAQKRISPEEVARV